MTKNETTLTAGLLPDVGLLCGILMGLAVANIGGPMTQMSALAIVTGGLAMRAVLSTTRHLRKVKETRQALTEAMQRLERHIQSQPPYIKSHDLPTPHIQAARTPVRHSRRSRIFE
ncbi:hypothetical protein [Thalassoroseus pseudoceratinae]|uniref:hypothetical protein n=1 Tax=Thalassoroseus pseudoceratinae TaxID=2713176 RepID=UPI001420B9E5|nr:hypothetical protein [Thalassoroseus pseudoceratinae]